MCLIDFYLLNWIFSPKYYELMNDQCTEEAHRPVDCATVGKWILKNSAESENMNW